MTDEQKDDGGNMTLYVPAGYRGKMNRLAKRLQQEGVDLSDQRGNVSISALFRYLIDKELEADEEPELSAPHAIPA